MRQSGRTTQMLIQAAERKRKGHKILIVVHEAHMITYCMGLAYRMDLTELDARRDFCTAQLAVRRSRFRGMDYGDIFVDHAVWELCGVLVLRHLEAELDYMKRIGPREPITYVIPEKPDPLCSCSLHRKAS